MDLSLALECFELDSNAMGYVCVVVRGREVKRERLNRRIRRARRRVRGWSVGVLAGERRAER
ncbi:MAG TPA: hypothetical protein VMS31_20990 [Pyrinomonadaceae bacterium]|nr:hypothetical protein [Pyrinomonadaceae bacterium]